MTPDEIDIALTELTNRMERVRALYEQYFMGIERLEPTIPRKDLDRRLEALRKTPFQNTAKRFKFQTLVQRYTSLQQYWYRTCRDIENGTYRKHMQKAQRRFGPDEALQEAEVKLTSQERAEQRVSAQAETEAQLAALLDSDRAEAPTGNKGNRLLDTLGKRSEKDASRSTTDASRFKTAPALKLAQLKLPAAPSLAAPTPAAAPAPVAKAEPRASAKPPRTTAEPSLSRERILAIHEAYQRARAETNATAVSFEKLERNIRETEAQLRAKHQGKDVDFDVSVKDGKAILKPRLK